MKRYFISMICLIIILIHCAAPKTFVHPEYQKKKITDAKLLISATADSNVVHNENVFEDIGFKLSKNDYLTIFGQTLENNLEVRSKFLSVDYIKSDTEGLTSQNLKVNEEETITLKLPENPLKTEIRGSVFILYLQDVDITMLKERTETSKPNKYYGSSGTSASQIKVENIQFHNYYVSANAKFAIVDNKNSKVVSYGSLAAKEQYMIPNSAQDVMNKTVRILVKDILNGTPFK